MENKTNHVPVCPLVALGECDFRLPNYLCCSESAPSDFTVDKQEAEETVAAAAAAAIAAAAGMSKHH